MRAQGLDENVLALRKSWDRITLTSGANSYFRAPGKRVFAPEASSCTRLYTVVSPRVPTARAWPRPDGIPKPAETSLFGWLGLTRSYVDRDRHLIHAAAEEFALDGKDPERRIPGERMKMGEQHLVPLSHQAVAILRELEPITGPDGYVFPSLTKAHRPLSENAITAALRRMGYSGDQMTWHGFRTIASTLLNEQGWHPDLIELQLAHAERNKVRDAYNKEQRLPERRKMMQAWSDYLAQTCQAAAASAWPTGCGEQT